MSSLISLKCPSCGGKLKVSTNATSLTCQHCGTEHMVKHEAGGVMLEAFARCPQCGRNDKSEKVTAVIASQTQEISGTELKNEMTKDAQGKPIVVTREVPFARKQTSILGQKLALLPEPDLTLPAVVRPNSARKTTAWGTLGILFGVLILGGSACGGVYILIDLLGASTYRSQNDLLTSVAILVAALLFGLFGIGLLGLGIFLLVRAGRLRQKDEAEYQDLLRQAEEQRDRVNQAWKRAVKRWNQLYYCGRDDCVFIPGENSSAPISELREYLYK